MRAGENIKVVLSDGNSFYGKIVENSDCDAAWLEVHEDEG